MKHSIEEFHVIVARHGCYKSDIETFVKAAQEGKLSPLYEDVLPMSDAV